MKKIMLIDDVLKYGYDLKSKLEELGYDVYYSPTAHGIMDFIKDYQPELLFLDIELREDRNGIEVCEEVTRTYPDLLVIIISSHADPSVKVKAVKAGALSYVEKPLTAQLLAAYAERYSKAPNEQYREMEIDFGEQMIYFADGSIVGISPMQSQMLKLLNEREGKNVTFAELKAHLWGEEQLPTNADGVIYNAISSIRRIINRYTVNSYLRSIHGIGYCFINGERSEEDS